jgi:RHS repeat-associated protein
MFGLFIFTFSMFAFAQQVTTGEPPFGSFGGGSFDTVNLGNLNVHFAIPVLHKAGRGTPFDYDLSYDNSVFYSTMVNGTLTWQPVYNWGWRGQTEISAGYLSYSILDNICYTLVCLPHEPCIEEPTGNNFTFSNFVYHDAFGVPHPFAGSVTELTGSCGSGTTNHLTPQTTDGSGYTIQYGSPTTITSRSGTVITPPVQAGTGAATITDANGNQISVNSSGVFEDTLGTTALTVAGTAPSPTTFTYTGPAGSAAYTMKYGTYNIKTNFGCSGIAEYSANSVYLVSSVELPDGTSYSFSYETNGSFYTGRLASVTLPTGGSISYSYTGGSHGIECADGSNAGLTRTVSPGGEWQYGRTQVSGNHWQTKVTTPPDPSNSNVSDVTVIDFEEDSSATNNFYETQRVVNEGASTALNTTITCYNGNGVSSPSSCPTTAVASPISRTTVFNYLPTSSGSQSKTDTYYNSNGLVTDVYDYDFGSGAVGSLLRHTATTYASLGNGIVDRPASIIVHDGSGNVAASTSYGYDESGLGTPSGTPPQHISVTGSRGNLTSITVQVNGSANLYRKFTYYTTGMMETSTDVSPSSTTNGVQTTYNYSSSSCGYSFVTSITEPLSLSRSMSWDCNGGVLLSVTDENGKANSTAYSGSAYTNDFWRPYSTTDEAGYTNLYTYPNADEVETALSFDSSVVDHVNVSDGLGRPIISQTRQAPGSSSYDSVETTYDALNRATFVSLPYVAGRGTSCSGSCPGTSTTYDALNRALVTSDSGGGSTTRSYSEHDVYQSVVAPSGENPKRKQFEYDALGRLSSVCEVTSSSSTGCAQTNAIANGYWTKHTYNGLGNLIGVTQNAQGTTSQTRTYAYDLLGRLTSETNPESGNQAIHYYWDSAASGCTGGSYSTPGNLGAKQDASGFLTCFTYDSLHRVLGFNNTNGCVGFQYDSATPPTGVTIQNGLGRLINGYTNTTCSGRTNLSTDRWFSYTPRGEITGLYSSTPHSNGFYHLTKTYWPSGTTATLSGFPGVPTIYYGASDGSGLDGEGRVIKVTASSGGNLVTGVTYNTSAQPIGALTQVTYGSGDFDQFSYDASTGRMTGYQYNVGTSGQAVVATPSWNANGTLQSLNIVDPFNSANQQNCTYSYDDLTRVSSVSCNNGAVWGQTFSYDPFGNIQKSVPTGATGITFNPTYDQTTNHYSTLCGTLSYDTNGNLTNDCFHSYQWDAQGHPVTVDSTSNQTYDAFGQLAELSASGWVGQYLYDETGHELGLSQAGSGSFAFIPLPGGGTALYNGSLQNYGHVDWLGTSRLTSAAASGFVGESARGPFGEPYATVLGPNTLQDFSHMIFNIENDLYDTHYREYHPTQGRWITPDPAGIAAVDPTNPQTWNRYAYTSNNPLSNSDPLGLYYDVCDPSFVSTDSLGFPVCGGGLFPIELPIGIGIGGGGGGGNPRQPRNPSSPSEGGTHGPWPGNLTTGLPQIPNQPQTLDSLLSFLPGFCNGSVSDSGDFLGTGGSGTFSVTPFACLSSLLPLPALGAAIAEASGDNNTPTPKGPDVLTCTRISKDPTPNFGACQFTCRSSQGRIEAATVALYRIQKACPPPRSQCPVSLEATPPSGHFGPIEFGTIGIIAGSCVYGSVQ